MEQRDDHPESASSAAQSPELGTWERPLVDIAMTEAEAFAGLDPACPPNIRERQRVVEVRYLGFDGKIHQGQLVLDRALVGDIQEIFQLALDIEFPFQSVIPISHPRFRKEGGWDDNLSMDANNTSAFNYRVIAGSQRLSNHAYGRAIDINPLQNPYIKGNYLSPTAGYYAPDTPGTLTPEHPLTRAFLKRGWNWGGFWETSLDFQHFDKLLTPTAPP